jgi:hypothetical protein
VRPGQWVALTGMAAALALTTSVLPASAASGNRVTNAKYGYTFVLPKGWNEVSLSHSDVGKLLGGAAKLNAGLKQALTSQVQSAAAKGLKTFAVRAVQESGGFFANINVGVFAGSASNSDIGVQVKGQLISAGANNVTTNGVQFPFGSAVEATYTLALTSTGQTVYGTQVYASHAGSIYIVTFSAVEQPVETKAATTVMPTWRFR